MMNYSSRQRKALEAKVEHFTVSENNIFVFFGESTPNCNPPIMFSCMIVHDAATATPSAVLVSF